MHDLNTITRLNAERFADGIKSLRAQGRYVLAKYDGLALVSIESFSDHQEAVAATTAASAAGGASERVQLFAPLSEAEAALARGRDQSEDRTVGDYAARLAAGMTHVDNSRHGS